MFVCRYVVCISFAFTPIAGVQSCAVLMQLLLLLFAVYLVFLVGNLVDFPFLFTLPWMSLPAGVSGFEGREVVFEVICQFNI
jgi:hypothetical protein